MYSMYLAVSIPLLKSPRKLEEKYTKSLLYKSTDTMYGVPSGQRLAMPSTLAKLLVFTAGSKSQKKAQKM